MNLITAAHFMELQHCAKPRSQGFITLLSVLVVSAVGVGVALTLLTAGIADTRSSGTYEDTLEARALADVCAETALGRIKVSVSFAGNATLAFPEGSCEYFVTAQSGENRTITARGIEGSIVRKVEITVTQISPRIVIGSWREVADF